MNFLKFILKTITVVSMIVCATFSYHYVTDLKVRKELKKECFGENCPCFNNIVDYRLTKKQATSFLFYLRSRKTRPETKIMEFTDFDNAKQIMDMFNVCQLDQIKIQEEKQLSEEPQDVESEEQGE